MAVGFYSGTSTGPNDLIDKLRLAAIAESFTIDDFSAVGAGYRLHMHKTLGGEVCYFNLRSAIAEYGTTLIAEDNVNSTPAGLVTGLIVNGSTGYDAGELWHKQPGYPQNSSSKSYGCVMSPMSISAIPSYYFFFVGDSVHVVVEVVAGKFQMMSFGMMNKDGAGAYTGGQYFTATLNTIRPNTQYYNNESGYGRTAPCYFISAIEDSNGAVYVDADSVASWRQSLSEAGNILFPCPSGQQNLSNPWTHGGITSMFWDKAPNAYNAMSAMCPIYTFLRRSDNNFSLIGWPEGVRFLNVTNYTPAQEITYGAETWMVFHSNGVDKDLYHMYCGFAFLKDDGS